MISNGLIYFIVGLIYVSFPVGSAEAQQSSSDAGDIFYLCRKNKSVRWLRAHKMDNGKCQALYSKEGYLQIISSATYFSMCEGVLHSVQKNLEEGGYKCILTPRYSFIDLD